MGLPSELIRVRVAERLPVAVGENATAAPQLDPAKRVAPQVVLDIKKSPALAPDIAMLMGIVEELSLVTVTCCEFPDAPTGTPDQESAEGATFTPETEMQPVTSRAHQARSEPRTSVPGAIRVDAGRYLTTITKTCRHELMESGEILAEPGPRPAGAILERLPGSCIFSNRERDFRETDFRPFQIRDGWSDQICARNPCSWLGKLANF